MGNRNGTSNVLEAHGSDINATAEALTCPGLPSAETYLRCSAKINVVRLGALLTKEPGNLKALRVMFYQIGDGPVGISLMGGWLLYFLQRTGAEAGFTDLQIKRIMNILTVCPSSAGCKDGEGMNALHYFFMRDFGSEEFPILRKLLECNPELPLVPNNFGETPLLQLLGQPQPCLYAIRTISRICPAAFRTASLQQNSAKLPLHCIMMHNRLSFDNKVLDAARLVFKAYPEAAKEELEEDRLILRVGGPTERVRRKWTPYERASECSPALKNFMENVLTEVTINRLFHRSASGAGYGASAYYSAHAQNRRGKKAA